MSYRDSKGGYLEWGDPSDRRFFEELQEVVEDMEGQIPSPLSERLEELIALKRELDLKALRFQQEHGKTLGTLAWALENGLPPQEVAERHLPKNPDISTERE